MALERANKGEDMDDLAAAVGHRAAGEAVSDEED